MRKLLIIVTLAVITTAIISTSLTFVLFQQMALQEKEALKTELPSQLVNNKNMNVKPKALPEDFVETASRVTPSIVNITISKGDPNESKGSGVILTKDGYIATNNHVVGLSERCKVTLSDKREFIAKVVGRDKNTDLALIKVDANNLKPISFGDSDNLFVGEWVLAIGNPFNLASTVTAGIVSAKGRGINILEGEYTIESFIQTDAAVNPGNSGGALVNSKGQLVGINSAIMTETGAYQGYSFAIPVNLCEKVFADLKEYGSVQRAILGVRILSVNGEIAKDQKLKSVKGVLINEVFAKSSAATAGLKEGDVIIKIDGKATNSTPELQEQVAQFRPGDEISISYIRNGKEDTVYNVKLKGLDSDKRRTGSSKPQF